MKNLLTCSFILLALSSFHPPETTANWTTHERFFQAHRFSDEVTGLTVELGANPWVDSAFRKFDAADSIWHSVWKPMPTCTVVDTSGQMRFYKHAALSKLLLEGINPDFYVYCTKGIVVRRIQDAVFSPNECISSVVVMRFAAIDTAKYGHPLFCSWQKLALSFGKNATLTQKVVSYETIEKQNYGDDYTDSMKSRVCAWSDTLVLSYSDNFRWNHSPLYSECMYPSRSIFIKTAEGTLRKEWVQGLDLFGIPCD